MTNKQLRDILANEPDDAEVLVVHTTYFTTTKYKPVHGVWQVGRLHSWDAGMIECYDDKKQYLLVGAL